MSKHAIDVTDLTFNQEVVNHDQPVLVDFWASWCGPCKVIGPVVEELAVEYKDRVKVAKVDVDQNREIAGQLGIMSIPTLVLFKNRQEVDRVVGVRSKEQLKQLIDQQLA